MKNKNGFILSTYVYILLVFFLLLLGTMLAVLNNTRLLSNKLKEQSSNTSGLIDKDFSFILLGDEELVLRTDEEFVEPGYKVQTPSGTDLSETVKVEGTVNTSTIGDYRLTYRVTHNGITKELTRIVHVVDKRISNYISELYTYKSDDNGLIKDNTVDKNIRYSGNYVNNYVEFGNTSELWRIIGIFNVTTSSGSTEKLVKIVRNSSIGGYSWDSSTGDNSGTHEDGEVNDGWGVNQWGASTYTDDSVYEGADLMRELNDLYLNQRSGTCYKGSNNLTATCDFTTKGIGSMYWNLIENVVWNTGSIFAGSTISVETAYLSERGTTTGKICTSGTYCNDSVIRTTTWQGKVGLIYPSDYGYASTDKNCRLNINDYTNYPCKNNNWLHNNAYDWTLSPILGSNESRQVYVVIPGGVIGGTQASHANSVRPSIYLKSNVSITSGDGSISNPYKLSM